LAKESRRGCRCVERKGRSWRPVPPKVAAFGRYRRDFDGKFACQPRRYVAGKVFRSQSTDLWKTAAAVQRLAF